jgi:oligopeptide transport system substrate-binding protein
MTFLDIFLTEGGNNQPGWSNSNFDQSIDTAKKSREQKIRMQALHDAEQILMTEMPVIPIYYDVRNYVIKDYLKGVYLSPLGFIDFKNATIQK